MPNSLDHSPSNDYEDDSAPATLEPALHTLIGAGMLLTLIGTQITDTAQAMAVCDLAGKVRAATEAIERWSMRQAHAVLWFLFLLALCTVQDATYRATLEPVSWIETLSETHGLQPCCEPDV